MARKPNTPKTDLTASELDDGRLQEAHEAAEQLGKLQANYGQGRDLINQMLGQAQSLHAASDLLRTGAVSKHAQIKEHKLYQQLAGMQTPHGAVLKGTWEEYCQLLGRSVDMVDRDISNLQAFGEEALEAMSKAGIGYRDLRKFRRLGADEKTLLIEAAKSGDKDELLELAETLISKHTREKETLEAKVKDLSGDLTALDSISKGKEEKINQLSRQVAKFSFETDWPEQVKAAVAVVDKYSSEAEKFLGLVMQACTQSMEAAPTDEAQQQVWAQGAAALAKRVRDAMARQKEVVAAADAHFASTLGLYLED
jgi:hypothetical protein